MHSSAALRVFLTGKMGSGKSYCAAYLERAHGAARWSRTELMKRLAHSLRDHIGSPDDVLQLIFADAATREEVMEKLLIYMAGYEWEASKPRQLYQDVTQICQDADPLCFERELDGRIRRLGRAEFSLIDDVRSLASFEYFSQRGYTSVRIDAPEDVRRQRMLERDGSLPDPATFRHPSEIELDEVAHDHVLINDGDDLEQLYSRMDQLIAEIRSSKAA